MRYKNSKFGRDLLLLKGTLRREECTFTDVSCLPFDGFASNTILSTLHAFPTKRVSFISIGN